MSKRLAGAPLGADALVTGVPADTLADALVRAVTGALADALAEALGDAFAAGGCDAETDEARDINGLASSPITAAYLKLRDVGIMLFLDGMNVSFRPSFDGVVGRRSNMTKICGAHGRRCAVRCAAAAAGTGRGSQDCSARCLMARSHMRRMMALPG
jgi:hypothetical protein